LPNDKSDDENTEGEEKATKRTEEELERIRIEIWADLGWENASDEEKANACLERENKICDEDKSIKMKTASQLTSAAVRRCIKMGTAPRPRGKRPSTGPAVASTFCFGLDALREYLRKSNIEEEDRLCRILGSMNCNPEITPPDDMRRD